MIEAVLLVFSMNGLPPRESQTRYDTLDQCADFVDLVAGASVVDDAYKFDFTRIDPSDGLIYQFEGRCIIQQEPKND